MKPANLISHVCIYREKSRFFFVENLDCLREREHDQWGTPVMGPLCNCYGTCVHL